MYDHLYNFIDLEDEEGYVLLEDIFIKEFLREMLKPKYILIIQQIIAKWSLLEEKDKVTASSMIVGDKYISIFLIMMDFMAENKLIPGVNYD